MRDVRLGICGLGTVGSGVFNLIRRNSATIAASANRKIIIDHVGSRRNHPECDTSGLRVSKDIFEVAKDPSVDVVAELIGGTTVALDLVMTSIEHRKHIVTANKALIAEHGEKIFDAARRHKVMIGYEAAVAGGIPIVKALREGLSGNHVNWLAGIINGTSNYILSEMDSKGREFSDVLKEAQKKGYAEADPTFDIEGIDAAHKLAILTSLAFSVPLNIEDIYVQGITDVDQCDLAFARELGYAIKHLGIARQTQDGIELRVHPTLVPKTSMMAAVNGVLNAVMVNSDAAGSTLFYGRGAGSDPTASSVVADIIDISRVLGNKEDTWIPALGCPLDMLAIQDIVPVDQIETCFYLRFLMRDKPGALSEVTKILGDAGISIEAIVQKEPPIGIDFVNVIVVTDVVVERDLNRALGKIEKLATVQGQAVIIRLERLDQ